MIEQPQVHILALGGSSLEDQLAIIGDRTDCLNEIHTKVVSSKGIELTDIDSQVISQLKILREEHRTVEITNVVPVESDRA